MRKFAKSIFIAGAALAAALLCACQTQKKPTFETAKISDAQKTSYSLFEERLGKLVKETEALARDVEQKKITPLEARLRLNELSDVWSEFAAEHPENIETQILYGKFLRSARFDEAAYKVFLRADKLAPNIAVVKQQLSTYETETGNYSAAYAHIKDAINLEPQTSAYHAQLGEFLASYGKTLAEQNIISPEKRDAEMLSAFKKASEIESADIDFLVRYAQAFYDVQNPDLGRAQELWQKAESLAPLGFEKDEMRLNLARVFIMKKDFPQALETLNKINTPKYFPARDALKKKIEKPEK
ncbi:MAG: hypothetical protein IKS15_01205 [Opitutales bacterium]|nr:hypothetical protein [Opitutales bacterium]